MKKWWAKFKEIVYLIGLIGIGSGWYIQASVSKKMNALENQTRDAKIAEQEARIHQLEFENTKITGYVKENADNIVWLVRVFELSD